MTAPEGPLKKMRSGRRPIYKGSRRRRIRASLPALEKGVFNKAASHCPGSGEKSVPGSIAASGKAEKAFQKSAAHGPGSGNLSGLPRGADQLFLIKH